MHQSDEASMNQDFGVAMREARARLGISQRKLAELLDDLGMKIDPSAVTRIEKGQREPKFSEAVAISDVLGINLDNFSYSATAIFQSHLAAMASNMQQARRAIISAGQAVNLAMENLSEDAEQQLLKTWGRESLRDLISDQVEIRGVLLDPSTRSIDDPGARGYVPVHDDDGATIMRLIVEGVTRNIYYTPEAEEELWERQRTIGTHHRSVSMDTLRDRETVDVDSEA